MLNVQGSLNIAGCGNITATSILVSDLQNFQCTPCSHVFEGLNAWPPIPVTVGNTTVNTSKSEVLIEGKSPNVNASIEGSWNNVTWYLQNQVVATGNTAQLTAYGTYFIEALSAGNCSTHFSFEVTEKQGTT